MTNDKNALEGKGVIDWQLLRKRYFKECTQKDSMDGTKIRIDIAPHDLFEWFKKNLAAQPKQEAIEPETEWERKFRNATIENIKTIESLQKKIEVLEAESIQGDAVEFAHKIGVAILKHSFEVIDTPLRKSVVEVGKIVMEFDKEGLDIIEHHNF